ncbi:Glycosyltransferase [Actinidia chinensis var. chinensis]|uniref:Glycosyltransferase n=1 Tax=Actinidia chinensis var. chinensis TaxID=1590841 RepID=A0A2R6Q4Y3_ACTCC|nr:Glycosyltransferase [Actinidia chinensis var. chinensis]
MLNYNMEIGAQFQRLCHVHMRRLLFIIGVIGSIVVLFQILVFPYESYLSTISHATSSAFVMVGRVTLSNSSKLTGIDVVHEVVNNSMASDSEDKARDEAEMEGMEKDYNLPSDDDGDTDSSPEIAREGQSRTEITSESNLDLYKSLVMRNVTQIDNNYDRGTGLEDQLGPMGHVKESDKHSMLDKSQETNTFSVPREIQNRSGFKSVKHVSPRISTNETANLDANSITPLLSISGEISSAHDDTKLVETQFKRANNKLLQPDSRSNSSLVSGNLFMNKKRIKPTSISQMNLLLLRSSDVSKSMGPQLSSPRDRELRFTRSQIENAPIIRNGQEIYASLFRNYSTFKRSYELMERMLKVYIYNEGDKPIFHQPHLRGIYASEGWFMKLIKGSKQFVTRDPRKAHLFYLPFSSKRLRATLNAETFTRQKVLENYLKNYTNIIAKKYRFWKRAGGADHFLVACHDWAPRITRMHMGSCIRALCNANVARDFKIGKDVSLPVTHIQSSQDPRKDLGGKPASERPILVFFAGGMHGYLRPILLQFWENKEPDMKIFGPMPRDIEGKTQYRGYMKSSKYCISARGYEVHTPRIVEAIYYECVPVIISDNYVPPFFEVLDWEAFSVFILEEDIPNLRNILLSIPEEKYLVMQQRVKMVQRHFLWHKMPVKYDLFHMILHSVWYNRVFQVKL